jgi:hypothetical protein
MVLILLCTFILLLLTTYYYYLYDLLHTPSVVGHVQQSYRNVPQEYILGYCLQL